MNTVIIKQDENGRFSIAASNGEPVRVIILEEDLNGDPDLEFKGTEYIATEVVAHQNEELVLEIQNKLD